MKFKISQKKLSEAVGIVQKAVPSRSTMPILEGILLQTSQGKIKLSATDQDISISTVLEAEIEEEGSIVIPSRIFGEIIRKLYDADIIISSNENQQLEIISMNSQTTLQCFDAADYPEIEEIDVFDSIEIQQNKLKDMIQRTIFSIAVEETRPILTGSLFKIENDQMTSVCLDGYRLGLRKEAIQYEGEEKEVIIPGKTLHEVSRILSDDESVITFSIADRKVVFDMKKTRLISKTLNGEFINHEQIIPGNYATRIKIDVKSIYESVERAWLVAKEGNAKLIKFNILEDKIIIKSNSETSKFYEEIPIMFEGKELEIAFNARYVMEALRVIEDSEVMVDFVSNVNPCVIKPLEGDHYIYLLLPVRLH